MISRYLRLMRERVRATSQPVESEELEAILEELQTLWAREVSPRRVAERTDSFCDIPGTAGDEARLASARSVLDSTRKRVGPPPSERDLQAAQQLKSIRAPSFRAGAAHRAFFSRDGRWLATLSKSLTLFDVEKRSRVGSVHTLSHPIYVDFDDASRRLAVKHTSGRIVTVRLPELAVERDLKNEEGEGAPVLFSADGAHLIDGSWNGDLTVRDVETGNPTGHRSFPDAMVSDVVTTPTRDRFACLVKTTRGHPHPAAGRLLIWRGTDLDDVVCDAVVSHDALGRDIECIALRPDGKAIALATYGHIAVWDVATARLDRVRTLGPEDVPGQKLLVDVAWSPCGTELAVAGERGVLLLDAATLQERFRVPMSRTYGLGYSPTGNFLAAVGPKSLVLERAWLATLVTDSP